MTVTLLGMTRVSQKGFLQMAISNPPRRRNQQCTAPSTVRCHTCSLTVRLQPDTVCLLQVTADGQGHIDFPDKKMNRARQAEPLLEALIMAEPNFIAEKTKADAEWWSPWGSGPTPSQNRLNYQTDGTGHQGSEATKDQ